MTRAVRLLAVGLAWLATCPVAVAVEYPPVLPGVALEFPRDEGSHPDYRLEWWYVTGWLDDAGERRAPSGFQVTFFRVRTGLGEDNPSRFAPRQVLFAHAAIADPARGRLRHAQRSAREGFGLAFAATDSLRVRLDDWSFTEQGDGRYRVVVRGEDFSFDFVLQASQPPMLQGDRGFSRKGPDPRAASRYYSLPQLSVQGRLVVAGKARAVSGRAWFDHEWSSDYVDAQAAGWDWLGVNLADGGALMAFRMRDARGGARWAAAHLRGPQASPANASAIPGESTLRTGSADEVEWTALETWRSPRTGVEYPVRWRVRVGHRRYRVEPLMHDAELDSRASTGVLYWEGPVRLLDDASGRELGRGYLELTGYGGKVDF